MGVNEPKRESVKCCCSIIKHCERKQAACSTSELLTRDFSESTVGSVTLASS